MEWSDISPADAVDVNLRLRVDIRAPRNEMGEPCPWPWEPQQLRGAPMGQYHCSYCGGMNVAGIPHINWSAKDIAEMERGCRGCGNGPLNDGATMCGECEGGDVNRS